MTKPERYQLPFDFGRRPDRSLVSYEIGLAGMESQAKGGGRFVRAVREEVIVRSPYDAAQHLLERIFVPIDAFDQEELFVLLLNTKNRITHEALVYRGVRRITASYYRVGTTLWEGAGNPQAQPT